MYGPKLNEKRHPLLVAALRRGDVWIDDDPAYVMTDEDGVVVQLGAPQWDEDAIESYLQERNSTP